MAYSKTGLVLVLRPKQGAVAEADAVQRFVHSHILAHFQLIAVINIVSFLPRFPIHGNCNRRCHFSKEASFYGNVSSK